MAKASPYARNKAKEKETEPPQDEELDVEEGKDSEDDEEEDEEEEDDSPSLGAFDDSDFAEDEDDGEDDEVSPDESNAKPLWEQQKAATDAKPKQRKVADSEEEPDGDAPEPEKPEGKGEKNKVLSRNDKRAWNSQYYDIECVQGENKGWTHKIFCHHARDELIKALWEDCGQESGVYRIVEFTPRKLTSHKKFYQSDFYYADLPKQLPNVSPNHAIYQLDPDRLYLEKLAKRMQDMEEFLDENDLGTEPPGISPVLPYETPSPGNSGDLNAELIELIRQNQRSVQEALMRTNSTMEPQSSGPKLSSLEFVERVAGVAATLVPVINAMMPKRESASEMVRALNEINQDRHKSTVQDFIMPVMPLIALAAATKFAGNSEIDPDSIRKAMEPLMDRYQAKNEPERAKEKKSLPDTSKRKGLPDPKPRKEVMERDKQKETPASKVAPTVYNSMEDFVFATRDSITTIARYYPMSAAIRVAESGNDALLNAICDSSTEELLAEFTDRNVTINGLTEWLAAMQNIARNLRTGQQEAEANSESNSDEAPSESPSEDSETE